MSDSVSATPDLQPVGIVITDQVAASIATKLDGIAKSAVAANTVIDKLQAALGVLGNATSAYNTAALNGATAAQKFATAQLQTEAATSRAATAQQQLAGATTRAAAAQASASAQAEVAAAKTAAAEALAAKAATDAAAAQDRAALAALRLSQAQDKTAASAKAGSGSIAEYAKSALLFVGISYGITEIAHLGDEYVQLQNRIQSVSSTQADANQVMAALFQISQQTRSNIEQTVTSFQRLDTTMAQLGQTQSQTIGIVKTLNEVIALASPTATNAKNGILELDKAFSAGELHGQQLRAILTDLPQVVNTLASHLQVVNGVVTATATGVGISRGEFEKLASSGKITAQVMAGALEAAAGSVDAKFQQLTPTLFGAHGAVNVLQNDFIMIVGKMNQTLGITTGLAAAILALSNNLPQLAVGLVAIGAAMLVAFGPEIIAAIWAAGAAIVGFTIALAANPFGLVVIGATAAFVAVDKFGGGFKQAAADAAVSIDAIARFIDVFYNVAKTEFENIPLIFSAAFEQLDAIAVNAFNKVIASTQELGNKLRTALGWSATQIVQLPTPDLSAAQEYGAKISAAVNKGLQSNGVGAVAALEGLYKPTGTNLINAPRTGVASAPAAGKPDKELASDENSILKAINPLHDYQVALQAAKALLDAGKISQDQYNQEVVKATQAYKQASDPLYDYNRDMQQQLDILKLLPDQQAAAQKIQQIGNELLSKGIVLTDAQTASIRRQILAIQEATRASQAQAQLQSIQFSQRDFGDAATAISKDKSAGALTRGEGATATSNLIAGIGLDPKNLQVQSASYISIYKKMYAEINTLRQKDLITERDAQTLRVQVFNQQNAKYLDQASTFFDSLQSLSSSHNTAMAAIGKAAAVSNAIIHTYEAATEAYAAMASIPYVGPVLGAVAAGAAIAAGLANVEQIKSQPTGFAAGGYTGDMDTTAVAGVVHGREYVMDAASTSRIGVGTLNQLRAGAASVNANGAQAGKGQQAQPMGATGQGGAQVGGGGTNLHHTNVNVLDPKLVGDFMNTKAGHSATVNVIRQNRDVIRQVLK